LRVLDGEAVDVVVEVREDIAPAPMRGGQPLRPRGQRLVGVAAAVPPRRPVKSHVDEWPDRDLVERGSGLVVQADRDAARVEQAKHLVDVPRRVAELDHVPDRTPRRARTGARRQRVRQRVEKRREAIEIQRQRRRQLIQHGAEAQTE
jgi:hypothetical protein